MKYKIVDKKAPRFTKTGFQTKLEIKELHKEFLEQTGIKMNLRTFKALYVETMDTITNFVTTDRNGVVLPEQMGNIHLALFKMKRPYYDFVSGMETGTANVENLFESDFLQGKIFWDYKTVKYKPRDYRLYGFVGCRNLKKEASKAFIETPHIFKKYLYKNEESRKKLILERYERYCQGSDESAEGTEQGS